MIQGHTRRDGHLRIDALRHFRTLHRSWVQWMVTCEYSDEHDRALHRSRTTMAAASGSGVDVQDRTRSRLRKTLPTATTLVILLNHYFFQSIVDAAVYRTSERQRGYGRRPGLSSCMPTTGQYGRNYYKALHVLKGYMCGSASICEGPHAGFPRRRGSGRTPRRRQVELSRLARTKGCFDTRDVWS